MKYKEAMAVDRDGWTTAVDEEHQQMIDNKVWRLVKMEDIPPGAKILTFTLACKLKSNGRKRTRINSRSYKQVDGVHYDSISIRAPITNQNSVHIVMVLALMAGWVGHINDVKGAFLKGSLDQEAETMYMKVAE
eukprot:10641172-Ditylum_brightwellii.AAC.1